MLIGHIQGQRLYEGFSFAGASHSLNLRGQLEQSLNVRSRNDLSQTDESVRLRVQARGVWSHPKKRCSHQKPSMRDVQSRVIDAQTRIPRKARGSFAGNSL